MSKTIPEAVLRKTNARAAHYGLDKLSERLLLRIARHKLQCVHDRFTAIVTILRHKLPIPVITPASDLVDGKPKHEA